MRGKMRRRAGFSNLTSTIILTSVLLSIMIVTSGLSNEVLTTQMAASEFNNGQNIVVTVDSEIQRIKFKPVSSTIIKASFSTIAPGFVYSGEYMNVTFRDSHGSRSYNTETNLFKIDGRQAITGNLDYDLQGNSSLLVSPYVGSFGRIRVSKPENWRVSVDYNRILYVYTGTTSMFNGTGYTTYNTFEFNRIMLTFGKFATSENSVILIQKEGTDSESFALEKGNWNVTVTAPGIPSETMSLSDMGGNVTYRSLVNFNTIHIKISVLEGS